MWISARTKATEEERAREEREHLLRELDHRVRNDLSSLMGIIRFHLNNPPATAASALSRVAGQVLALSAIYDMSRGRPEGCGGDAAAFCSSFVANIERNLCPSCRIGFKAGGSPADITVEAARTLAIALGEMLLDAAERATRRGASPEIEVSLDCEGAGRFSVRVKDASSADDERLMASVLARAMGGSLGTRGGPGFTERELSFSAAEPGADCRDGGELWNQL